MRTLKPINVYRSEDDRDVWEQAEKDAETAGLSVSAYIAAVLRNKGRPVVTLTDEVIRAYEDARYAEIVNQDVKNMPAGKALAARTEAGLRGAFKSAGVEVAN